MICHVLFLCLIPRDTRCYRILYIVTRKVAVKKINSAQYESEIFKGFVEVSVSVIRVLADLDPQVINSS